MVNPAKLRPPALRVDSLPRRRLNALLDSGASRALTVLQASGGFGKTTVLAGWLADRGRPVAWLSLDAQDDDPRRLLAGVVAAVASSRADEALSGVAAAIDEGAELTGACLAELVAVLESAPLPGLVLVLDDVHVLRDPATHALLRALVDAIGPTVPTIVASRTRPPLRLARRLAAGEASVIDADTLAFAPDESALLLNQVHELGLGEEELGRIAGGLRGWPVGLSMLVLELRRGAERRPSDVEALVARSSRQLVDYVVEELLAPLSPEERRLRLCAAVVERVNAPLAAALLDSEEAHVAGLLEAFRQQGQLTASDGETGGWLSVHDLVRRPLTLALEREEPGLSARMHLRASRWFESEAMVAEAMHHAVAAGDSARVDELLRRHALELAKARRTAILRRALALGPAPDSPVLALREALDLLVQLLEGAHQGPLALQARALAERHVGRPEVQAVTSLLVATPFGGDMAHGIAVGHQALERFGRLPGYTLWITPGLAGCLMFDGRSAEARALVEPLISTGVRPAEIFGHAYLALICLVEGDPATAEWHGSQAVALLDETFSDLTGDLVWVRGAYADALRVSGHLVEARRQLDRSLLVERNRPGSVVQGVLLVSDAELSLAEGRRARARTSARRAHQIYAGCVNPGSAVLTRLQAVEADLAAPVATPTMGSMPTPAELRVLELLASTPSRAAIAAELFLSESTVKSHLRRIYRRLGVSSREEALVAARARGLLGDRRRAAV